MAKSSTGATCPLCEGQLTEDKAGKGFVRHKHRPTISALLADQKKHYAAAHPTISDPAARQIAWAAELAKANTETYPPKLDDL